MYQLVPFRYGLAVLVFLGTLVNYATRVNINIAILEMTRNHTTVCSNTTEDVNSVTNDFGQTIFCWSAWQQGYVKTAFYYGYPLTQLIGGYMAEKFGTRLVFGLQNFFAAILVILTPWAAHGGVWVLVALRFAMGLIEGVTYPSLPPLIVKWIPVTERARFVSFSYLGGAFGSAVAFPISGYILEDIGWEAVFYATGGVTIVWSLIWLFLVTDEPENNRFTSSTETMHILASRGEKVDHKTQKIPILAILTNPTIWIVMICDFANIWGILVMINEGPNFIDKILKQNISTNGVLSALPHLWTMLAGQIFGFIADLLITKEVMPTNFVRKVMHSFGFLGPAFGLALLGYVVDDWKISVAIMAIGYGFRGATYSGHTQSPLDLTPTFSGTVYGLCNGFGAVSGLITPLVATALTANDPEDIVGWRTLFLLSFGVYTFAWFLYVFFVYVKPLPFDPVSKTPQSPQTDAEKP